MAVVPSRVMLGMLVLAGSAGGVLAERGLAALDATLAGLLAVALDLAGAAEETRDGRAVALLDLARGIVGWLSAEDARGEAARPAVHLISGSEVVSVQQTRTCAQSTWCKSELGDEDGRHWGARLDLSGSRLGASRTKMCRCRQRMSGSRAELTRDSCLLSKVRRCRVTKVRVTKLIRLMVD